MSKIVKKDAKPFETDSGDLLYGADDFIEIKLGWRPGNYIAARNEFCLKQIGCVLFADGRCDTSCNVFRAFEAGFDACIEAMENQK